MDNIENKPDIPQDPVQTDREELERILWDITGGKPPNEEDLREAMEKLDEKGKLSDFDRGSFQDGPDGPDRGEEETYSPREPDSSRYDSEL